MGQITGGKLLLLLCFFGLSVQAVSIHEIIAKLLNRLDPGTIASNAIDETLEISGQVLNPSLVLEETASFDCRPQAYVRAPDLYPGLITQADARLALNGTTCDQIIGWKVGLRLKERAMFKIRKPNVFIPERPKWNRTAAEEGNVQNDDVYQSRSNPYWSVYDQQMKDYDTQVANKDLWIVKEGEREVFDTQVELDMTNGTGLDVTRDSTRWLLRSFQVNVPNTNFPPQRWVDVLQSAQWNSRGSGPDRSVAESMFEYYFSMTLQNGTAMDVPAGKTGFLPAAGERSIMSELEEPYTLQSSFSEGREPYSEWDWRGSDENWQPKPNCEAARIGSFELEATLQEHRVYTPGQVIAWNVTLRRTGNTTEIPRRIWFTPQPRLEHSWAQSWVTDSAQQRTVEDYANPDHLSSYVAWPGIHLRGMLAHRETGRTCESLAGVESNETLVHGWYADSTLSTAGSTGQVDLEGKNWNEPIIVEWRVPQHTIPDFNATFRSFRNLVVVSIETVFGCEDKPKTPIITGEDITDVRRWRTSYNGPLDQESRFHRVHQTNFTITVNPSLKVSESDTASLIPYTESGARAIQLSQVGQRVEFPLLDPSIRTTEDSETLKFWKYEDDYRVDRDEFSCTGGAKNLVSEIWARKDCP